jgi:gas vesicle protein
MNRKIEFDFGKKKKIAKERKKFLAKGLTIGVAAGSALGALCGMLFAPKSGKETRQQIKNEVTEAAKKASDEMKVVSEKAAVGLKEVSGKATDGIKDIAAKANEIVKEKMKLKKDDCSCCEEVAVVEEASVTGDNIDETEKAE